jgi:hypothetical protein
MNEALTRTPDIHIDTDNYLKKNDIINCNHVSDTDTCWIPDTPLIISVGAAK